MVGDGIYYPGDPVELRRSLQTAFRINETIGFNSGVVVAPFGAYRHCLPYLVSSLKATGPTKPKRVILLAPAHSDDAGVILVPEADTFETPFGALPVATGILGELTRSCRHFVPDEIAHLQNHTLEVLLPAVHYHYGTVPIVPLLVTRLGIEQLTPITDAIAMIRDEVPTQILIGANLSSFTTPAEADAEARKLVRLVMTAPGPGIIDTIPTLEDAPRSTWPLAVGHILAGYYARPHILSRGSFDTEYEGAVGTVVFSSIAYITN
jgi:AmmeMemoRadiSam system protein B